MLRQITDWVLDTERDTREGMLAAGILQFLEGAPDLEGLAEQAKTVLEDTERFSERWREAEARLQFDPPGVDQRPFAEQLERVQRWRDGYPDKLLDLTRYNAVAEELSTAGLDFLLADAAEWALPARDSDDSHRELTDVELAEILETLPRRPLLAGEKGVRLSLAGAQDKIAVRLDEKGRIYLPLNHAPSTHILKPAIATWEGLVSNEAYCMALAHAVGLNTAPTSAHRIGAIEYLRSERYDRSIDENGSIHRLHQEDFCQALGVPSAIKYQAEGGPGLEQCFALLRVASRDIVNDVRELLRAVFLNLLIGNNDAHAKNYSILYGRGRKARLAPLYDLVCTVYYPEIDNRLAMKIGGQANPDLVGPREIEVFAREANLAAAATKRMVSDLAELVREKALDIEQSDATAEKLSKLIARRCEGVISRFR